MGKELSIIEQRVKQIRNYIDRMPSLSTTVTKVLEVCNRPNTSANDLNRVISLDPVLTGQVLKLINSAYYSLPNQITSLARAIIMLGLNTVKNLALSTAIIGTIGKAKTSQGLPMDTFWAHSICVGVTSKAIAAKKGVPVSLREEYFVAGLLHDLGKIPLASCFPVDYDQVLELAKLQQGALHRAETMILGVDHSMTGKLIAEKWQLSAPLASSLSNHHKPDDATWEERDLVTTVALANIYANIFEIGSAGDFFQEGPVIFDILELAGMTWDDITELHETVHGEVEKAQVFLKVSREG